MALLWAIFRKLLKLTLKHVGNLKCVASLECNVGMCQEFV